MAVSTPHCGGQVDFSTGDVRRGILDVAAPMLVAQVLNLLYNIVDRIYIGKIPGEGTLALAGLGLCFPIVTLVTAFANLFGVGGAPLCSIARAPPPTSCWTPFSSTSAAWGRGGRPSPP